IGFSILTFVMVLMQSYVMSKQLERKYPDAIEEFNKNNKRGIMERIFVYIRTFIVCFVPLINIAIFYIYIFDPEQVEEKVLSKISKK
ncbi:MAG: hypothetical protein UHD64_03610, partial [Bacteroidales bacterium]|nr:hypothetical protein [Bacteroidales bacterium]